MEREPRGLRPEGPVRCRKTKFPVSSILPEPFVETSREAVIGFQHQLCAIELHGALGSSSDLGANRLRSLEMRR